MNSLHAAFEQRLNRRRINGTYRELTISLNECIDFASNDYLGILHNRLLDALIEKEGREAISWGSGGSRLLTGNSLYCEELEREIAQFHQAEAGLIFNSGYAANLGILTAVASPGDTIIYDQDVHASLHDAVRLSRAKPLPFRHGDLAHLARRLEQARGEVFVCAESVYSCDGSQPDLAEIQRQCQSKGAHLIVDEAHATGWLGPKGVGVVQMLGLQGQVFARVHTFSKALGGQGAIVLGSSTLREYLLNFSRPFIYTTALPSRSLAAVRCAYKSLENFQGVRERLQSTIQYFRSKVKEHALTFEDSHSVIQNFRIPGNEAVKITARRLQGEGFDVRPLVSPTVRRGKECLRMCLHAFNTEEEIDALLNLLGSCR